MNERSIKERLMALINNLNNDQKRGLLHHLERQKIGYRKHKRKDCMISADYTIGDKTFKGLIKNISFGGVFVRTKQTHSAGRDIYMDFQVPTSQIPIGFLGKIVRSDFKGFAVEFSKK